MAAADYEMLDERFGACGGERAVERLFEGLPLGGGAGLVPGGPLPRLERHPERPPAALGRVQRLRRRLSAPGRLHERQHRRPPGPAPQLRARRAPGHAAPSSTVRSPCIADRYEGKRLNSPNDVVVQLGRLHLVHRPRLRHRVATTRGTAPRARSTAATSTVSTRPPAMCASSPTTSRGPNGLAFSPDERLLYVSDTGASTAGRSAPHPPASRSRRRHPLRRRGLRHLHARVLRRLSARRRRAGSGPAPPTASTATTPTGR